MIKASELRINNLLALKVNYTMELCAVTGISGNSLSLKSIRDGQLFEDISLNLPQPIPLTPELLEKCGFEKAEFDAPGDNWYEIIIVRHRLQLCLETKYNMAHIVEESGNSVLFRHFIGFEYLHQLQNLYFALTGEELEVKL